MIVAIDATTNPSSLRGVNRFVNGPSTRLRSRASSSTVAKVIQTATTSKLSTPWRSAKQRYEEWIPIIGELHSGYQLMEPLLVHVWIEGAEFVADAPAINLHAFGHDVDTALTALAEEIVDHYEWLEELGDAVSQGVAEDREFLRLIVQK